MTYTSRHNGPDLTPEEQDARTALVDYTSEDATCADWVPTTVLYRIYRHWRGANRWRHDPEAPPPLTPRQFGRAIRRLFPAATRCRRRYHGKEHYGYCHITGPECIHSTWLTDRI